MHIPTSRRHVRSAGRSHASRQAHYLSILNQLTGTQPEIKSAVLATADGRAVAAVEHQSRRCGQQLAALASSLVALSHIAGREAGHDHCEQLVVESADGKLLVRSIGAKGRHPLLLCLTLTADVLMGSAQWTADEITEAVEALGSVAR